MVTPFGRVRLLLRGGAVVEADLLPGNSPLRAARTGAGRRACRVLKRYFADPRASLAIPIDLHGTPFQRRVWRALGRIRPGQTLTYGELARRLETGARAVGGACRANPVPLFVPCHRVVAAGGAGGFMGRRNGPAVGFKRWLLEHECLD